MDNKFTKKRIANTLSYDWTKMIALILGIVLFWTLAYTIGAPRASTGQVFCFNYYTGDASFSYKYTAEEWCNEFLTKKVFSYDVLDYSTRIMSSDYFGELMMTSTSVGEGDVMITVDSQEKVENNSSEFRQVIDGYGDVFYDYDSLIKDAKSYCIGINSFVQDNGDGTYSLNEAKIEEYFSLRMVKDPRYRDKQSERFALGVQSEIQRIKAVWNNAVMLEECLLNHPEIRYNYVRYTQAILANPENYEGEEYKSLPELTYGINLGKLTGGEVRITDEFYKPLKEGEELSALSADGIVLLTYNFKSEQPHLQFETLSVVNYFISRYSNFLNDSNPALIK